ncbi:hypothetical protein OBBRIDRAFT_374178 [Obba rivulosa]|uniref:Endonuclease/exonuclease/phosphatase domain-containing protein n=1 Tax=Obba rivulosa TaxID=1052685 RepID=A0A8E2AI10_9APHY|nr:hypothetical protein OBBRIDRAFT_374178 [Obba rivulosa]
MGLGRRKDGKDSGEFSPIFYKKSRLTLISHDSFWLSETPFKPSKYPGAGHNRVCTAGHFMLTTPPSSQSANFTVFNTHLDHRSDAQRRLSASLLLTRARYETHTTRGPVFVMGDLNSPPIGRDAGAYKILTGQLPPMAIDPEFERKYTASGDTPGDFTMRDLGGETPKMRVSGHFATFTGFKKPNDAANLARIDFIFGGSNGGWSADAYKVISTLTDDGILASDHRPVITDVF